MYNNEVWGEERFRPGPCTKSLADVAKELSRIHADVPCPGGRDQDLDADSTERNSDSIRKEYIKCEDGDDKGSNLASSPRKPYFSSKCLECLNPVPDPKIEWMTMYLHAYRYKGSDWEFKTDLPDWAQPTTATSS